MNNIAFACGHLSTGGMPRYVYNSIKYLDPNKYKPYVFEASHAGVDEIRDQILALPGITHHLCTPEQFIEYITRYKIDLIHYHDWDTTLRPRNIPSIETVHTPFEHLDKIGYADLYLLVSEHQQKLLGGRNYQLIDLFIDEHEFDAARFENQQTSLRAKYGFNPTDKIIMNIGVLAPYQAQAKLLQYWNTDMGILVFVGPLADNFKEYWQPLYEKYNSNEIRFIGAQKEMAEILFIADIVCTCRDFGASLATLEAGAMRKPLVLSDIPANRQIFTDGQNALIRKVDDSFINSIKILLEYPLFANLLADNAYDLVQSKYSVEKYTKTMENIYDSFKRGSVPRIGTLPTTVEHIAPSSLPVPPLSPQMTIVKAPPLKKILHVEPESGISIPPKGYGAVERTIAELQKRLTQRGYQVDHLPKHQVTKAIADQYDYVHSHFYFTSDYLRELNIPYILTVHDAYIFLNRPEHEFYQHYDRAIRNSVKTIALSTHVMQHYPHLAHKMVKIPNGVDIEFFTPPETQKADSVVEGVSGTHKDFLLSISRVELRKNLHLAVKAAELLGLPIKIAGPEGDGMELLKKSMQNYSKAEYLGAISIEEAKELYRKARIFVLPSRAEVMALAVLEAMASGLPVVATQTCCYDFETEGLIKCDATVGSITTAIVQILGREKELGQSNRTFIERFSWENIADDYINLLYASEPLSPSLHHQSPITTKIEASFLPQNSQIIIPVKTDRSALSSAVAVAKPRVNLEQEGVRLLIPPETPTHSYTFKVYKNKQLSYETTIQSHQTQEVFAIGYSDFWYTEYSYELLRDNELYEAKTFSLNSQDVLIDICSSALGDTIAWMPYIIEFQKEHGCNLTVKTNHTWLQPIVPQLTLCQEVPTKSFFIKYFIGVFDQSQHPINWRNIPLQQIAADMLGLYFQEKTLDLTPLAGERNIQGKYVCIAPHSTMQCKEWNYYGGGNKAWQQVVDWLVTQNYKVVWIAKEPCFLHNVVDRSGDRPIQERITDLKYSDFYIGLPAGLSWVAHYCQTHVFMITGFAEDWCEFQRGITRITQKEVCRGCFNDATHEFERMWAWCPRNKNFECTKFIEPNDVINAITTYLQTRISTNDNKLVEEIKEKVKNTWLQVYPLYHVRGNCPPSIHFASPRVGEYRINIRAANGNLIWSYSTRKKGHITSVWVSPSTPLDIYNCQIEVNVSDEIDLTVLTQPDIRGILRLIATEDFTRILPRKDSPAVVPYRYYSGIYLRGDWDYIFTLHPKWQQTSKLFFQLGGGFEFRKASFREDLSPIEQLASCMCFGDLHTIMQIISHHEIKKIIEFGTYTLGTAHLLSDAFPEVKIISVDINDPGEDCKKAWKEFVPQPNIEFILGDINKIGENLILKERPDMLIIDYEHRAQSTLHFVDFAIQQGVKAIIIHDVNDVTSECNFGDVAAAMHIISTYDDKYQILKTPYQQGILALINPHTNDTNKLHEYSGNLSIRDIRVSKSDAVVSACVTADRGKYTNYYLSYNQPSWVTLNIVKPTPDGRYELKLFDNSTKELLGNNQVDANRGNIYHFCSVTGHPWYTEYLSRVYHNGILDYEEILDLRGKNVFIEQLHAALGDTICLVPLIFEFQKKHQCKVEVLLGHGFIPGFPELYDDTEHVKFVRQPSGYFIKYQLLIEAKRKSQLIKLGEGMTDVLGIEYQDCIYDLTAKAGEPTIPKPYVCIAPTCVRPDKQWHWQGGMTEAWQQVVDFLRDLGYQVVVISLEQFPLKHVIDKTGNLSLLDRVNDLTHAEFFIGLSSGLSWLAHNCKKFVFMLIGPIASWHEFETNVHKIYNHECDCLSCANNPEIPWNYGNCPLPEKNYECTRYLEPGQVITEIEQKIRNGIQYDEWRIVTPLQNRTVLDSEFPKVGFCNGGKGGSNGVNESIFDKSTKSIS